MTEKVIDREWADILDYEEHDPSHTVLKHYPYEGNDIQAVIDFLMGFFNIKREELK